MRATNVQDTNQHHNRCSLCGLPNVQHPDTAGCVLALRREYDRLRLRSERSFAAPDSRGGLAAVGTFVGYTLVVIGVVFALGRTFVHLALALSLWELPTCPGFVSGVAAIIAGAVLVGVVHGRLAGRPPRTGSSASSRDTDCHGEPVAFAVPQ